DGRQVDEVAAAVAHPGAAAVAAVAAVRRIAASGVAPVSGVGHALVLSARLTLAFSLARAEARRIVQQGVQQPGRIRVSGPPHAGCGYVIGRPGLIDVEQPVAVVADADRRLAIDGKFDGPVRRRHDTGAFRHAAALLQEGERAIRLAYPGLASDAEDGGV